MAQLWEIWVAPWGDLHPLWDVPPHPKWGDLPTTWDGPHPLWVWTDLHPTWGDQHPKWEDLHLKWDALRLTWGHLHRMDVLQHTWEDQHPKWVALIPKWGDLLEWDALQHFPWTTSGATIDQTQWETKTDPPLPTLGVVQTDPTQILEDPAHQMVVGLPR